MKRHSYSIAGLVTLVLLGIIAAAYTSPAQFEQERATRPTINLKLDHFWCYIISQEETANPATTATLTDQFQTVTVSIGTPLQFCNPAQKTIGTEVTPIVDLNDHLTMYNLQTAAPLPTAQTLTATNQFGAQQFTVDKATTLM